jgi:chromosome partitioning protein
MHYSEQTLVMARIFTIINNKGGTGKTTTALNLGAALAQFKKKVLLIDLDSQCNMSSAMGIEQTEQHIATLMLGNDSFSEVLKQHGNISILPSSDRLLEYEVMINAEPGREYLLKECIDKVKDQFDYILIDCPPSLGIFSINSLVAADHYIVPMQTENFAFIGLDKILQVAEKVKKRLNPNLELAGILLIRYTSRIKFSQAVVSNIEANSQIGKKIFHSKVRQDINLMESSAFSQTIFEYAPKSRGAEDFNRLAKEIRKLYDER